MSAVGRLPQEVEARLLNIKDAPVPGWIKWGMAVLAVVWWISPVDDFAFPFTLIFDEIALTGLAAWVQTSSYQEKRNQRLMEKERRRATKEYRREQRYAHTARR